MLLVLEPVCQVVGLFGVAAAVFHAICAQNCAVEGCRTQKSLLLSESATKAFLP